MGFQMLAVDNSMETSFREQTGWQKHGISMMRVEAMREAIELLRKRSFIFTVINADCVNYKPLLKVMRDISPSPIFIIASDYSVSDLAEALLAGADAYAPFQSSMEENITMVLAMLKRCNEHGSQPHNPTRVIMQSGFIVSPAFRKAFYCDEEILLTTKEFDLLLLLIEKPEYVFTYAQIFERVWGMRYDGNAKGTIWVHVGRLRDKLLVDTGLPYHIKTVRDVGYCFAPCHCVKF